MKTLFLYDSTTEKSKFFQLEGDYSHLDNVFINEFNADPNLIKELTNLLYDTSSDDWDIKVTWLDKPTKDWDFFVHVGILE